MFLHVCVLVSIGQMNEGGEDELVFGEDSPACIIRKNVLYMFCVCMSVIVLGGVMWRG